MKARPSPQQIKIQIREGAVTHPTGRREYVLVGSTAADPAADACRSSNRTLFGTGIFVAELLHIEKLDKESKSTNFHSNVLGNDIVIRGSLPQSIRPLWGSTPLCPFHLSPFTFHLSPLTPLSAENNSSMPKPRNDPQ